MAMGMRVWVEMKLRMKGGTSDLLGILRGDVQVLRGRLDR